MIFLSGIKFSASSFVEKIPTRVNKEKALMELGEKWAKTYQLHTIFLNCNTI